MKAIRMVILDWAGTTMDFGCIAPMEAFRETFRRFGIPISVAEARKPMGAHKRVHIQRITEIPDVRKRWKKEYGRDPRDGDVEDMFKAFQPIQMEILPKYAGLIANTAEITQQLQREGILIGSTTGYTTEMTMLLAELAKKQGCVPDETVSADMVPEGRPAPWMCIENAKRKNVYPMGAIIKVGDTVGDILEGRNAGMFTIGVSDTGNEMGLSEENFQRLGREEQKSRRATIEHRLQQAGASMVIPSIADLLPAVAHIDTLVNAFGVPPPSP